MENALARCLALPQTPKKPRTRAMNLCLDDGLGARQTEDLFAVAGHVIDVIRLGRATAAVFSEKWLKEKVRVCREYQVELEIGGPLYEVAYLQGKTEEYFRTALEIGVQAIEVSVNIIRPTQAEIARDIRKATEMGLHVYFEYGRKYPDIEPFNLDEAVASIEFALEAGAAFVQVERSEIDLVIDREPEALVRLAERIGLDRLTFEAGPRTPKHAAKLLNILGADVNLASLTLDPIGALDSVLMVENARRGMERSVGYSFLASGAKLPFELKGSYEPEA